METTSLEISKTPMNISNFSVLFFIIGCILVPGLEKLKEVLREKPNECEATSI